MPDAAKIVGLGAVATAIGGAYKFGEFVNKAKRLHDVGPANAVYVRLINRVRYDLDEVQRLLTVHEVKDALAHNRPKAEWVYGAIRDTRGALDNITPHTERVAGDVEDGRKVGWRHRIRWQLDEKEKLANRNLELSTAHGSLCEVIGFLTALEPVGEGKKKHKDKHVDTRIDVDIHRGPERVEERDVWVEQDRAPRHVEERDIYIEREGGPSRVEERDVYVEHRGPRRVEEREVYVERGREPRYEERHYESGPRHVEEQYYESSPRHVEERYYESGPRRAEEREVYVERDPRRVEAEYYEQRPAQYEERRFEEHRYGRRSDEDRVPQRDTHVQPPQFGPYGGPAYGYERRRVVGDAGFGDEEVINPQPVPLMDRHYEREVWVEEKEDYRYDEYGNKLPQQLQRTNYPKYPRSRI